MKHIINADQRGLKFRNGKLNDVLHPGSHSSSEFLGTTIEIYQTTDEFLPTKDLQILLENPRLRDALQITTVGDQEIGFVYENNNFKQILSPGTHAFWKSGIPYKFKIYDLNQVYVPKEISASILSLPSLQDAVQVCEVASNENVLLLFNGKYQETLTPGKYWFWKGPVKVITHYYDLRQLQLDMAGQEIMTRDKVTLRLNFICHYKITDPLQLHTSIHDYASQLYIVLQLILREYIGNLKLDELLEQKEKIGQYTLKELQKRISDWGLKFIAAGVKDIVLPGEIKTILQQVIEAEKKALANTITRREETASTRSLLNTARLMQENPTLMKLREMEYIESISQKISQINLSSNDPLAGQLSRLFSPGETQ